ncbi:hypothetical protein LNI96_00485 [Tenacibaculum dicentrarchi]|uniref:hypothetical protein n=1 Tax=Tenacibaculum piscium TaxID=1458515 RepID=UPI001E63576B|nr:hypothetical protein [Tenacibaculum piscium]MCD8406405.1 hypothetical protein [Tenacibaculum dicentrarchi]
MNYGEEFVKLFNDKFKEILSESTIQFESYYSTNYSFRKAKELIEEPLLKEMELIIKSLNNRSEIFEKSHKFLNNYRYNYISDITISLINDEVKEGFILQKKQDNLKINYLDYLILFSEWEVIRRYFIFIRNNDKELNKKFLSRNIGDFLTIVKKKNELHTLANIKEIKKQVDIRKESMYALTQNEKMILLHVLLHRFVKENYKKPSPEYFRVLSLVSGILEEKDINKAITGKGKYNYFLSGVNASRKSNYDKNIMIDVILSKIKDVKGIKNFISCLKMYKQRK